MRYGKKRKLVRRKKTCEENLNNDLKLVAWLWAYRLFYQNFIMKLFGIKKESGVVNRFSFVN